MNYLILIGGKMLMPKQRVHKVSEEIKREISNIIRELKDPRIAVGMVSITGVEATGDLSYAKIFISIFGEEVNSDEILNILQKGAGFIRSELAKRIRIRHIPELIFQLDKSMEYGDHINKILKDLNVTETDEESK